MYGEDEKSSLLEEVCIFAVFIVSFILNFVIFYKCQRVEIKIYISEFACIVCLSFQKTATAKNSFKFTVNPEYVFQIDRHGKFSLLLMQAVENWT